LFPGVSSVHLVPATLNVVGRLAPGLELLHRLHARGLDLFVADAAQREVDEGIGDLVLKLREFLEQLHIKGILEDAARDVAIEFHKLPVVGRQQLARARFIDGLGGIHAFAREDECQRALVKLEVLAVQEGIGEVGRGHGVQLKRKKA
jgi:hypothetical protein